MKPLSIFTFEAHGRVNLIGEHTDYNGGFVLPTAIPQRTQVRLEPHDDDRVEVTSASVSPTDICRYALGEERATGTWHDYVQGVTFVLRARDLDIRGFHAHLESTVPMGSGLSSSAALEIALLRALRAAFDLPVDDVTLARLGQKVENDFVGARVGIMDQMAASLATQGEALFLDTRDLSYRNIPLPREAELIVIESGLPHRNAHGEYNARRAECEAACRRLSVAQLRELTPHDLHHLRILPSTLLRRARHVITENARVLEAVQAIEAGDLLTLGELFRASHTSLRDDYEVSLPEIDVLTEIANSKQHVYGCRLTGGGFGGSVVALAEPGWGTHCAHEIASEYRHRTSRTATVLVPEPPASPSGHIQIMQNL